MAQGLADEEGYENYRSRKEKGERHGNRPFFDMIQDSLILSQEYGKSVK